MHRNKLLIFGIILLLFVSFASALVDPITGVPCSTDTSRYEDYNDTGFSCTGTNCFSITFNEDISDGRNMAFFMENWKFGDGVGAEPYLYLRSYASAAFLSEITFGNDQGGYVETVNDTTMIVTTIPLALNTDLNLTFFLNISEDNYDIAGGGVTFRDLGIRDHTENFGEIYGGYASSKTVSVTGAYRWNCTGEGADFSCECPTAIPSPGSTLNLSSPLPIMNSSFNVDTVNFNLTANSSLDFNCSIFINDIINATETDFPAGENIGADVNITFNDDGEYNYTFQCLNTVNTTNTSTITFFMDFTVPEIVTNFFNNSFFYLNNLTGQWNFTDNILLHTFNISVDGKLVNSTIHIHETTHQYNLSYNVTNFSSGIHNITVFITDGHTAAQLKDDYDWSNGLFDDYMEYEFVEGGYIRTELKDKSIFDKWTTTRLFDRYTQTLHPANPSDTLTFVEESDTEIFIVNKPGHYKGQWVIVGNHWKDYILKGESDSEVSIKRINKYKVEVTISNIKNNPERLEFESIGDLNIIQADYSFIVSGAEETFEDSVLELQTQTITLRMNKTDDITTSAILIYNGSEKSVGTTDFTTYDLYSATFLTPSIDTAEENVTFYWTYNFTGPVDSEIGNLTFGQTINEIGFDNCTTFTIRAINITVKNETSGTAIIDNSTFIRGYFKAWASSESNFTEFNLSWGGRNQNDTFRYGLCIDPADAAFTINAQLEYGADNFETKLYYFNDYALDNETDILDLFLIEGTTQVTLTVKDFDDSVVDNAVIKVLSYDIATDSSTTTEIVETDSNGEAFVQLVLNTEWYVFIVEVEGIIKLQTIPTRVTSSSKTLRIDLQDIRYFDRYDVTRGISHSLTWTNATNTFTFTWSDPSGDIADACLKVSERNVNTELLLSNTCTTSAAGTRTYTIVGNISNQVYVAVSYVKFPDGESYILNTLVQSFEETFKKFGLTGIFVSFLLILTLIGIGIWHPVVAVLLGLFGLIVTTILGIFAVSWGVLIGLIIMGGILLYRLTKN